MQSNVMAGRRREPLLLTVALIVAALLALLYTLLLARVSAGQPQRGECPAGLVIVYPANDGPTCLPTPVQPAY